MIMPLQMTLRADYQYLANAIASDLEAERVLDYPAFSRRFVSLVPRARAAILARASTMPELVITASGQRFSAALPAALW